MRDEISLFFLFDFFYNDSGDRNMKVKLFDFEHEKDLEDAVNDFFSKEKIELKDLIYQTSHFACNGEQIYSFSCLILYK